MSSNDGGEKTEAEIVDLASRIAVKLPGEDASTKIAAKLMMVIIQSPATPVEHLVALGMVGKAIRTLLRASGMPEVEIDSIATQALHLSLQYPIEIKLKEDPDGG